MLTESIACPSFCVFAEIVCCELGRRSEEGAVLFCVSGLEGLYWISGYAILGYEIWCRQLVSRVRTYERADLKRGFGHEGWNDCGHLVDGVFGVVKEEERGV